MLKVFLTLKAFTLTGDIVNALVEKISRSIENAKQNTCGLEVESSAASPLTEVLRSLKTRDGASLIQGLVHSNRFIYTLQRMHREFVSTMCLKFKILWHK